ncbi:MAG TPA: SDR family oxidoreductase [Gaiellaceae bacterium]|jgi:NAD(P)-dependent dehydrogenase (short-subunit alcohol dehydrogenase family)
MSEVVVVTGASSGVGRAIAREFGLHGASVGLVARGRDGLEAAAREIEEAGGRALVLPTDVADHEQVDAAAEQAERELGPIDVWVNNAMTTVFARFLDVEPDEYRRATEVTYLGAVWGTRAALQRMSERDRGSIVLVGSALAYRGIPLQAPYCGAKHGIQGFFESLRCELRHDGSRVRLTTVHLPGVNTPQFDHCRAKVPRQPMPVPPIYEPEVAARAVYWAAHNDRRELYVGLPTVYTILGNKVAPWFAEWYLARTAVDAQQVPDDPIDPNRPDNLFEPVAGDPGAHGRFDGKAHGTSPQAWVARHRGALGLAAAGAAAAGLVRRGRAAQPR